MPRRRMVQLEFAAEEPSRVLRHMAELTAAQDGWINLLPGIADGEEATEAPGLFPMFSNSHPGVTMCTWMPPSGGRRPRAEILLGITHTAGRRVVPSLTAEGLPVPYGWQVRQDNPRRGLIVAVPADERPVRVLDWGTSVAAALSTLRLTGLWRADVYLPMANQ
jgi:hypothetical protein